jgi:hypothetical protein
LVGRLLAIGPGGIYLLDQAAERVAFVLQPHGDTYLILNAATKWWNSTLVATIIDLYQAC